MNGLVTRATWGAASPHGAPVPFVWANVKGLAVHYTDTAYDFSSHNNCAANVRFLQQNAFSRGYRDIEYNYLVCSHGYVFEGRTFNDMSGANGVTIGNYANLQYGAVSFMSDGSRDPGPVADCFVWVRDQLLTHQPAATEVWPHQHFVATACPNTKVLAWLATSPFNRSVTEEDPMILVQKKDGGPIYHYQGNSISALSDHQAQRALGLGAKLSILNDTDEIFGLTHDVPGDASASAPATSHTHPIPASQTGASA